MADFLDRLGDELGRAARVPIGLSGADAAGPTRLRGRWIAALRARGRGGLGAAATALAAAAIAVLALHTYDSGRPAGGSQLRPMLRAVHARSEGAYFGMFSAKKPPARLLHGRPALGPPGRFEAGPAGGSRTHPSAAANRRAAPAAAKRLFARLRLPAGAREVEADEAVAGLSGPFARHIAPHTVEVHRFFHADGVPCKVMSWIYAHPPAGSSVPTSMGPGPDACKPETLPPSPQVASAWGAEFAFGELRERFYRRSLLVTLTAAKGGGTAIRVDAEVQWMQPRPASRALRKILGGKL